MRKPQRIGYRRVSTTDQTLDRQLLDVKLDVVYEEKISGKNKQRPQLQAMLAYIHKGDNIVVHELSRLGRSLEDLLFILRTIRERGASIEFVTECMRFDADKENPMANAMFQMLGVFAEFQRKVMLQAQAEGIAVAREKGVYDKFRKLTDEQIEQLRLECSIPGANKSAIAKRFGIHRDTLYTHLRTV